MSNGIAGKSFTGTLDYTGLWIGNIAEPYGDDTGASVMTRAFRRLKKDAVLPTQVTVPAGAPFLSYATYSETTNGFPNGVTVTITQPDGTVLDSASPLSSANPVGLAPNGSVAVFALQSPMPGTWTFTVAATPDADPFQMFVSTLPNADGELADVDIEATLRVAFPELADSTTPPSEDFSLACTWCQVGMWALAILIIGALLAASATITIDSAIVLQVAIVANVRGSVALAFIQDLLSKAILGVAAICVSLCTFMNQCP